MEDNFINKTPDSITVSLVVLISQEDENTFLAYCPALELSSYGDTLEDAQDAFHEALGIFIEETMGKGTLEKALLSLGWTLKKLPKPNYLPPALTVKYRQLIQAGFTPRKEQIAIPV